MTDQEEFEKWAVNKNIDWESMFIKRDISFFNHGWQACAERKNAVIEQQAKEIAVFRKALLEIREVANEFVFFDESDLEGLLLSNNLIDEDGNPTSLLTGKQK